MLQRKSNRASINLIDKMLIIENFEVTAMCWLHQHASSVEIFKTISTPANSVENLIGISSSPKALVKKSSSKTRATSKDTVCLVCGMCLIGKRCSNYFQTLFRRRSRQQFVRVIMRISENPVSPAENGTDSSIFSDEGRIKESRSRSQSLLPLPDL